MWLISFVGLPVHPLDAQNTKRRNRQTNGHADFHTFLEEWMREVKSWNLKHPNPDVLWHRNLSRANLGGNIAVCTGVSILWVSRVNGDISCVMCTPCHTTSIIGWGAIIIILYSTAILSKPAHQPPSRGMLCLMTDMNKLCNAFITPLKQAQHFEISVNTLFCLQFASAAN